MIKEHKMQLGSRDSCSGFFHSLEKSARMLWNQKVAARLHTIFYHKFVECHSHRYNLAVKDVVDDHNAVVAIVYKFMRNRLYSIPDAMLC